MWETLGYSNSADNNFQLEGSHQLSSLSPCNKALNAQVDNVLEHQYHAQLNNYIKPIDPVQE